MSQNRSPQIAHCEWGKMRIEGYDNQFRDVKLFPSGVREWDWSETGTHHQPGIQIADVQELLDKGASVIVLSKGYHERLHTMPETLAFLEEKGITVHVLETGQAVAKYNTLCESEAVGALIHSTC